ncbi:MAG: endo-1,4-beta-xylanase [Melioribacteraceae bacterium]|nr:endo-1,4-beta-xylanase [Melioribacteraceae bacterium]
MNRRNFLRNSLLATGAASIGYSSMFASQSIITSKSSRLSPERGELFFKPYLVQKGAGPHIYDLVWATDPNWDTFYSDIRLEKAGIRISESGDNKKFGINARWNVEGFGYTNITADNEGDYYELPSKGNRNEFNLNYEFAASRVARNERRIKYLSKSGYIPGPEANGQHGLSADLVIKASNKIRMSEDCARLSQQALYHALWASEKIELDYAEYVFAKTGKRADFEIGCDARSFTHMDQDTFLELFTPLFTYANITFVPKSTAAIARDFEPQMGKHNFTLRDYMVDTLNEYGIKCQGRLLYWFHDCCIPDWMRGFTYDQLLKYAEKNTRKVVSHFGDRMYAWEMVNELHDWANEFNLSHEQTIELTRLITKVAKDAAPDVKTTINNCCPFAEYVQINQYSGGGKALHRQRTPVEFTKDILDAGIDIDIVEQQMYYPYRDLQDTILMIERYEQFNKPMHISEIGCPGGPVPEERKNRNGSEFIKEPYLWHHYWDEDTQADWIESIYTLIYSKEYIKAGNWFDFVDPYSYMDNGGILKSVKGDKKSSYHRLEKVVKRLK